MKKLLLSAAVLALAASSQAIMQYDVMYSALPEGAVINSASISVWGINWQATTLLDNETDRWVLVFSWDGPLDFMSFDFVDIDLCGEALSVMVGPDLYLPGAQPPTIVTDIPGALDVQCAGGVVLADELPLAFELKGAFPNPFNPTTTIEFALPTTEMVSLNVYNINGQLVNTLVNGAMDAGNHSVTFDASNLSSGVYLYTIEAGANAATNKMVLVK
jgi:hypothetical protein